MVAVVRCAMSVETTLFHAGAAHWVEALYPDVKVTLDEGIACLRSDKRDTTALRLIWLCEVANERLLARAAPQRAEILEELVR